MSQTPALTGTPDSLNALLLRLSDRNLLLPNVALAELVPQRGVQTVPGLPDWLLGQIAWRDLTLPLLSFERASGGAAADGGTPRVAVLNALGGRPKVKFLALQVQGIPRSVKVDKDLPSAADVEVGALELGAVRLGDEVARIPDLVALEQMLADAGLI